jgi:AP-1 complex subunit mu
MMLRSCSPLKVCRKLILIPPQAKAHFKRRSTANNVAIIIPVPDDADSPRFRTNIGTVQYMPENSSIVWKIKQFGGGKEFLMRAELGLPSVRGDDDKGGGMMGGFGGSMGGVQGGKSKRPIQVKFEIPYFTTSGIQVRYLKIIEPKVCTQSFYSRYKSILHHPCSLGCGRQWLQPCFG